MTFSRQTLEDLRESIKEGSFPASEELLTSALPVVDIPSLLDTISSARYRLTEEIRTASKSHADDVDEWIAQAKKVQADIARCKIEAKQIVEEHERVQTVNRTAQDSASKVRLLEAEITFNQALQHELETVEEISQVLDEAERHLIQNQVVTSAEILVSARASIDRVSALQTRKLLERLEDDLRQRCRSQLQNVLDEAWVATRDRNETRLQISSDTGSSVSNFSMQQSLNALDLLNALSDGSMLVLRKLERYLLPIFSAKAGPYAQSAGRDERGIKISLGPKRPDISAILDCFRVIVEALNAALPQIVQTKVVKQLMPKLITSLIANWLNQAIPYSLEEIKTLENLETEVANTASVLASYSWPGHQELSDWTAEIPKLWLGKRRMTSLDAVRKAYTSAQGTTRQVERIERQMMSAHNLDSVHDNLEEDDWNANWDDEPKHEGADSNQNQVGKGEEEEADGWDFETESNHSDTKPDAGTKPAANEVEDDSGEAWGWGDESPTAEKKPGIWEAKSLNGGTQLHSQAKEMILKEFYTITDIPDHILEVIGRDITDSQTLSSAPSNAYFNSAAPVSALQALPTLTLAMFRASAHTYYSHTRNLSSMNLYNDTLYISQRIIESVGAEIQGQLEPAVQAMSKFARQTYTRELDMQRTVLSDLLDGAQGFVSCNSDQYRDLSAGAVSAVVDRIRQLYNEYRPILSASHLLQTIGSLTTTVIGKVIHDIEDLEDISEKESERLVEYCKQISGLEDLFEATQPEGAVTTKTTEPQFDAPPQKVSTIALYVPNHFRFLYLAEILSSSLADIKYMWAEGGLNMEFTADEVVDLIEALFAESSHRKSAISTVRNHR